MDLVQIGQLKMKRFKLIKRNRLSMKLLLLILALALIPISLAIPGCEYVVYANEVCMASTPYFSTGSPTYDMYYPNNTIAIDDGTMSQVGSSGMYNFTINQSASGLYKLILSDNSTSSFTIGTVSSSPMNITAIAEEIWSYITRTITGGSLTPSSATCQVWNATLCLDRTTTGVAEEGW